MPPTKRILTLDILRGYFLLVIFTDHLFRFPSIFQFFTAQGKLWVSSAEGFFIISGLLVGYLYGPKILHNFRNVCRKLNRRALHLYLLSVSLTLLFTLWGQRLPPNKLLPGLMIDPDFPRLLFAVFTLKYSYGWADFLPFYAVFMFFSPPILLMAKKFNGEIVVILSFVVWLLFREVNQYFAWQFLFFSGMVIGDKLSAIDSGFHDLIPLNRKLIKIFFYTATVLTIIISLIFVFGEQYISVPSGIINHLRFWFDKNTVGPGRFLLAWLWFTTLYLFVRSHEKSVPKIPKNVFRVLGQNSLFVYCLQAVILFPVNVFVIAQFGFIGNSLFTLIGYFLIYFFTLYTKSTWTHLFPVSAPCPLPPQVN